MKTVCARNMPFVAEAFETLGDVRVLEGRTISATDVRDAEMLAIRSTTRVDADLLKDSRVRFVGTATIGTDHLDTVYLDRRGIRWCSSPGCNAESVAGYVAAALLCLAGRHGLRLEGRTLGIVGVGHVGSRVVRVARALGMRLLLNDPPRRRSGDVPDGETLVSLDKILAESDIVTMHVPLNREGRDATLHLADESFFARLKPGSLFLNSARGSVTDTAALVAALDSGHITDAVVDTWEDEPVVSAALAERAALATPHIAGHSYDGKVVGTVMVYEEACRFLQLDPTWDVGPLLPPAPVPEIEIDAGGRDDEDVLREAVSRVYDIEADDARMRAACLAGNDTERAAAFDNLRRSYPVRREYRFTRLKLDGASAKLAAKAEGLGFQTGAA